MGLNTKTKKALLIRGAESQVIALYYRGQSPKVKFWPKMAFLILKNTVG
jgi:hypothetical protein